MKLKNIACKLNIIVLISTFAFIFPTAFTTSTTAQHRERNEGQIYNTNAADQKKSQKTRLNILFHKGSSTSQHLKAQGQSNNKFNFYNNKIVKQDIITHIDDPTLNIDKVPTTRIDPENISPRKNVDHQLYYNSHPKQDSNLYEPKVRFTAQNAYINLLHADHSGKKPAGSSGKEAIDFLNKVHDLASKHIKKKEGV
jgi:hypothetical protein